MPHSNLYFTDTQNGKTALVFLHYFGGSERTWKPLIELLKTNYRCIAIDLWGFGSSPAPEHEIGVTESVEKVLDILSDLQLQNFVLIGHSMGGKIALGVAAKQPVGLQQIILTAPSPPIPEPMADDKRKELLATWGNRALVEKLIKNITGSTLPETVFESTVQDHLRISKKGWDGWLNKGSAENITDQMSLIKPPLSIIHGSKDPNFTMAFYEEIFNRYFRDVNFTEIPGAGHILPLEVTGKLADIIGQIVV